MWEKWNFFLFGLPLISHTTEIYRVKSIKIIYQEDFYCRINKRTGAMEKWRHEKQEEKDTENWNETQNQDNTQNQNETPSPHTVWDATPGPLTPSPSIPLIGSDWSIPQDVKILDVNIFLDASESFCSLSARKRLLRRYLPLWIQLPSEIPKQQKV